MGQLVPDAARSDRAGRHRAEALGAAAAIGDDRLQKMQTGTVSPEKWTHGSSEQRVRWFRRGYENGNLASCDTFAANVL